MWRRLRRRWRLISDPPTRTRCVRRGSLTLSHLGIPHIQIPFIIGDDLSAKAVAVARIEIITFSLWALVETEERTQNLALKFNIF